MKGNDLWWFFMIQSMMMIHIECIAKATIFAWDWLAWCSSIDLNIDLRMTCSRHSPSLNNIYWYHTSDNIGCNFHDRNFTNKLFSITKVGGLWFLNIPIFTSPVWSKSLHVLFFNAWRLLIYSSDGILISSFWTEEDWMFLQTSFR